LSCALHCSQATLTGASPIVTYCNGASTLACSATQETCTTTLVITDQSGRQSSASSTITLPAVSATAVAGGVYSVTDSTGSVSLDSSSSTVVGGAATYRWEVNCLGQPTINFNVTGPSPSLTYGTPGSVLGAWCAPRDCGVILTITDACNQESSSPTTISLPAGDLPVSIANGPYSPTAPSGRVTLSSTGSSAAGGGETYEWAVSCPGQAVRRFTGASPAVTYGTSSSNLGSSARRRTCNVDLTVTDACGRPATSTSTSLNLPASVVTPDCSRAYIAPWNPSLGFYVKGWSQLRIQ
jgi:hypothetical protein